MSVGRRSDMNQIKLGARLERKAQRMKKSG